MSYEKQMPLLTASAAPDLSRVQLQSIATKLDSPILNVAEVNAFTGMLAQIKLQLEANSSMAPRGKEKLLEQTSQLTTRVQALQFALPKPFSVTDTFSPLKKLEGLVELTSGYVLQVDRSDFKGEVNYFMICEAAGKIKESNPKADAEAIFEGLQTLDEQSVSNAATVTV